MIKVKDLTESYIMVKFQLQNTWYLEDKAARSRVSKCHCLTDLVFGGSVINGADPVQIHDLQGSPVGSVPSLVKFNQSEDSIHQLILCRGPTVKSLVPICSSTPSTMVSEQTHTARQRLIKKKRLSFWIPRYMLTALRVTYITSLPCRARQPRLSFCSG